MKKPLAILLVFFHILPSIPFAQQTETVAVIEFEGNGVSDFEVTALTDRFRDELVKLGSETVVERGKMEEVLKEQAFQQTGCTSSECAVEVGKLLSVQKIIVGSISKVGNVFSVSCRLVSVETGEILQVTNFDYDGEIGDLLKFGMMASVYQLFGYKVPVQSRTAPPSSENIEPNEAYGYIIINVDSLQIPIYLNDSPIDTNLIGTPIPVTTSKHSVSFFTNDEIKKATTEYEGHIQGLQALALSSPWGALGIKAAGMPIEIRHTEIVNGTKEILMFGRGETHTIFMNWAEVSSIKAQMTQKAKKGNDTMCLLTVAFFLLIAYGASQDSN
tara:strand:- start:105 stop:1094 length:990 start_codon:yes stop_codon:yes gene_type:complete